MAVHTRAKHGAFRLFHVNGFFILFIILWIPPALKAALDRPHNTVNQEKEKVYVGISGDIKSPGVYAFGQQPRLPELIKRGGGLKVKAIFPRAFHGVALQSGTKVRIQKHGDQWSYSQEELSAFQKITMGIPLSLNGESEEGLTAIPGIGPELAERIVKRRNEIGGFKKIMEIKNIYGIGDKVYQKILKYVILSTR